ncbi:hypothetical protein AHAT_38980 [Agarivorans sp. Toyoura001]|uniref:hypothetical protein n=1 Tax=Agarivorans sp. Toyoura001 TaxID=2283141 RepID=UPI0010EB4764|nr:hypothetical protein [Agarivorans sp. Toyoura001]GDY28008.1 hypothetical protein AHAT_38980 [Agarivorans sp. Toyoura001]
MNKIFDKSKSALSTATDKIREEFDSGIKIVRDVVNGLPVIVSLERTEAAKQKYDEKHYFVIPFHLCEAGFTLHTMRSLPNSVPEINDLPKRRIFHFPNEHYEATLREHLLSSAKDLCYENNADKLNPLESLANDIDQLDSKLTYGMIIVGGVAAIFNPLVGVGIAAKAVLPSISGLLAKHTLRPLGERLSRNQVEKEAKNAEKAVLKQFSESSTLKVTNPILQELELTLRTNQDQHDPLTDPNLSIGSIPELDNESWRNLTERAVYHVYHEVVDNPKVHDAAKLGPEDIRWLKHLFVGLT